MRLVARVRLVKFQEVEGKGAFMERRLFYEKTDDMGDYNFLAF